jgi:hypothetical protein
MAPLSSPWKTLNWHETDPVMVLTTFLAKTIPDQARTMPFNIPILFTDSHTIQGDFAVNSNSVFWAALIWPGGGEMCYYR